MPTSADERATIRQTVNEKAHEAVEALTDPDAWHAFLWAAAAHPGRTGAVNLALISRHAPYQTVASKAGWAKHGRRVRDEQHGFRIFTSVTRRPADDAAEVLHGFGTGTVYPHGATDPIPDMPTAELPATERVLASLDLTAAALLPPTPEGIEGHKKRRKAIKLHAKVAVAHVQDALHHVCTTA